MRFIDRIKSIVKPKRDGIHINGGATPWEPRDRRNMPNPARIVGTIGSAHIKPSEALEFGMQMTAEQRESHIKCFDPAGAKLLQDLVAKAKTE